MPLALVVDDDSDILFAITETMKGELPNYEVETARDGQTALAMWEEKKHPLIILDMMLPKRSGFLVLECIRKKHPKGAKNSPVVIMITGNIGARHKFYAEALGVDDYITKPFKLNRLMTSINRAIAKRG